MGLGSKVRRLKMASFVVNMDYNEIITYVHKKKIAF
jgi:hypothetical protein